MKAPMYIKIKIPFFLIYPEAKKIIYMYSQCQSGQNAKIFLPASGDRSSVED